MTVPFIIRLRRSLTSFRLQARHRLHGNLRLAIICFCGLFSVVAITPFAFFRLLNGQIIAAAIDATLVACIVVANSYAWRTGRTRGIGLFLIATNSLGCFAVVNLLGVTGTMWAYPVVLMNFFLADRLPALVASAVLIAAIVATGGSFHSSTELITFAVTISLLSLYASIFSSRTDRHQKRLEDIASRDPLTDAGNRRSMEADLQAATCGRAADSTPCTVIILDLDHFKQVNDRHGHEAGDRVLIDVVSILCSCLRRSDRLYRYGGEEFVLLLDADATGLEAVLLKLRRQIEAQLASPDGPVTVSMGVARHRLGEDWSSTLARADAALYMAKRRGRDCIVFEDANAPWSPTVEQPVGALLIQPAA